MLFPRSHPLRTGSLGLRYCRAALAVAVVTALLCVNPAAPALARAATKPPTASELAPGPLKRKILDVLAALRKSGRPRSLVAEPLDRASEAAERSRGARAAGDRRHARQLSKLGEQWALVAMTVLRAAAGEQAAGRLAKRMRALRTGVERAEALLGEQQARLGRLRAQLKHAEARGRQKATEAAAAESQRIKGARPRAGKGRRKGRR